MNPTNLLIGLGAARVAVELWENAQLADLPLPGGFNPVTIAGTAVLRSVIVQRADRLRGPLNLAIVFVGAAAIVGG